MRSAGKLLHTGPFSVLIVKRVGGFGYLHVEASPETLTTRLAEEILENEDSGGGRSIDELIDMEAFVQNRGRDRALLADQGFARGR